MEEPLILKDERPVRHALWLQIGNVVAFVAVVIANILSSTGALPEDNNDVSDHYPVNLTPAGYAFSIWGVIYFFIAFFVLYQAFPKRRSSLLLFQRINVLFIVSCLCNFTWTFLFAYDQIWASVVLIFLLLASVIAIYVRVDVGRKAEERTLLEYWAVEVPFSMYLAWLCVVSTVNMAIALRYKTGWDGSPWTETGWAILLLSFLMAITLVILGTRADAVFGAVIAWAFFAIYNKQKNLDDLLSKTAMALGIVLAVLNGLTALYRLSRWNKRRLERRLQPV